MKTYAKTAFFAFFALSVYAMPALAAKSGAEQMREFEYHQMKADVANYQLPFQPAPGKALVIVVRPSKGGGLVRFNVFVDSKDEASEVGYTRGSQYIYFSLTPGTHRVYSKAENWAETQVSVNAGDIVYLKQEVNFGMFVAGNSLSTIDEIEGKYRVKHLDKGEILKADDAVAAGANQQAPIAGAVASPAAQSAMTDAPAQAQKSQQQATTEHEVVPTGSSSETAQKLRELQTLWKEKLISDEEYNAKKHQLLEKF